MRQIARVGAVSAHARLDHAAALRSWLGIRSFHRWAAPIAIAWRMALGAAFAIARGAAVWLALTIAGAAIWAWAITALQRWAAPIAVAWRMALGAAFAIARGAAVWLVLTIAWAAIWARAVPALQWWAAPIAIAWRMALGVAFAAFAFAGRFTGALAFETMVFRCGLRWAFGGGGCWRRGVRLAVFLGGSGAGEQCGEGEMEGGFHVVCLG
jgi:hypothetical protein